MGKAIVPCPISRMSIARTICLGFLAAIAAGTLLLLLPFATDSSGWGDPLVALFTATSAVCVTGLIVVDTGSYFSGWGEAIVLLLMQIGGLGYMTSNTLLVLLVGRRFDLRQKFAIQETFDQPMLQGSRNLVGSIVVMTLAFEAVGFVLLLDLFAADYGWGRSAWLALFHSVSAWNNAGFSLFEDSLMAYRDSLQANAVFAAAIVLGGLGYQVIIELYGRAIDWWRRNPRRYLPSLNFKVVTSTTALLLVAGTLLLWLTDLHRLQAAGMLAAGFQSVTARTAGFNTIDIAQLSTAGLFATIALMFVGASPSGTGGGIKTTTLRILSACTRATLQGKREVTLYERRLPTVVIFKAVGVAFGSVAAILAGTILVSLTDPGFPFIQVLFEVTSAFATVGLSTGITGDLSIPGKLVLVCTMYVGRVGILVFVGAILAPPRRRALEYPEETLMVG